MGVDPRYYLDEMSQDEVVAVMKARHENYSMISREEWERTRLECFYSATAFGGKVKRPGDLFKFPWDTKKTLDKVVGKEEMLKRLQQMRKNRTNGK